MKTDLRIIFSLLGNVCHVEWAQVFSFHHCSSGKTCIERMVDSKSFDSSSAEGSETVALHWSPEMEEIELLDGSLLQLQHKEDSSKKLADSMMMDTQNLELLKEHFLEHCHSEASTIFQKAAVVRARHDELAILLWLLLL